MTFDKEGSGDDRENADSRSAADEAGKGGEDGADKDHSNEDLEKLSPEELRDQLKRARSTIVDHKRREKEGKKQQSGQEWSVKEQFDRYAAERDFYAKNPDAEEHSEAIKDYVAKGLSHEDAWTLVTSKDESKANRESKKKTSLSGWSRGGGGFALVTEAQFGKMTRSQRAEYMEKSTAEHGEMKLAQ